nr:reverse transcriptase domain-containing protein [Tanacetum cinerariifolium]
MPPRMATRSASRPTAASRGRGTGGRAGRGGGRTGSLFGDQDNGKNDGQGWKIGGQGSEVNNSVDGVPDFSTIIAQQLQNLLPTIVAQEFLACNLTEYDGKGGGVVYTCWIEKIESVQDMSGCGDNQKVKYTSCSFVGKALTWWNSHIQTLGREVVVERRDEMKKIRLDHLKQDQERLVIKIFSERQKIFREKCKKIHAKRRRCGVTSSSLEMLTNSCLGGIMVSLIFLEGLKEEALVEFMVELFKEDDKKSKTYGLFN